MTTQRQRHFPMDKDKKLYHNRSNTQNITARHDNLSIFGSNPRENSQTSRGVENVSKNANLFNLKSPSQVGKLEAGSKKTLANRPKSVKKDDSKLNENKEKNLLELYETPNNENNSSNNTSKNEIKPHTAAFIQPNATQKIRLTLNGKQKKGPNARFRGGDYETTSKTNRMQLPPLYPGKSQRYKYYLFLTLIEMNVI